VQEKFVRVVDVENVAELLEHDKLRVLDLGLPLLDACLAARREALVVPHLEQTVEDVDDIRRLAAVLLNL
jgi:hypothetical protein